MSCLVCGEPKTIRSHLMPRAMAIEVQVGKAHAIVHASDKLRQTQSGLYERNILCSQCDNEIGKFESTAITAFRTIREQAKGLSVGEFVLGGFSGEDIIRFVAGLLWKYSVASKENGRIILGPYQEKLKNIAFHKSSIQPEIDVILIRLKRYEEDGSVFAYRAPCPDRQEGVSGYRILVGGMLIFVKLDKQTPKKGALARASIRGRSNLPYAVLSAHDFEEYSIPKAMSQYGRASDFLEKQERQRR